MLHRCSRSVLTLALPALVVYALCPTPARAGRASACKAPPFAVPKETQRAVDAAIDARVVGAGAGGASTGVETRTEYETTTLSQDAAAKAWLEYTLCNKLARRLISQELHDELLRVLVEGQPAPPSAPAPAQVQDGETGGGTPEEVSLTPDQLVGTWQVQARFEGGSCPAAMGGGAYAYTMLISALPGGAVTAAVQGNTSYPDLVGGVAGGVLRMGGEASSGGQKRPEKVAALTDGPRFAVLPRTDYALRLEGDALTGTREVVTWTSTLSDDGQTYTVLPCVLRYDVRATR